MSDSAANAQEEPASTAAGAVPPTGGAPPEDARPTASQHERTSSALEDLVDGIDLLLRAARKTLHAVDPRVETTAANLLERLRELEADAPGGLPRGSGTDTSGLEAIAKDLGRELSETVQRLAQRVEHTFPPPR